MFKFCTDIYGNLISPNNMISFVVRLLECILQKCGFTFRSEHNTLTSKKKKKG